MSDEDLDFELITSATQLAPPPPLARKRVILPNWKTNSGKVVAFMVFELSALEHDEYSQGLRKIVGTDVTLDLTNNTLQLLAFCVRDSNGNRLWSNAKDAIAQLGAYGQGAIDKLATVARELNNSDAEAAEKNSEAAPSGSSNGISPSTSGSPARASS